MIARNLEPFSNETQEAIRRSKHAFQEIALCIPESFGDDARAALIMSFSSLVMEHFRAITMLVESQVAIGSALALFRPLLDTIIRAEWLYFCADDDQRKQFMDCELQLDKAGGFKVLAQAVDTKLQVGDRFGIYFPFYSKMCDYTHTGHDAVYHRLAPNGIVDGHYPEDRVRALLAQSAMATIMHFEIICDALGAQMSFNALVGLFRSVVS